MMKEVGSDDLNLLGFSAFLFRGELLNLGGGWLYRQNPEVHLWDFAKILHRFFPHFFWGLLLLLLSLGSTTCCWCSSHWVGSSISIRIRQELLDIFDLLTPQKLTELIPKMAIFKLEPPFPRPMILGHPALRFQGMFLGKCS